MNKRELCAPEKINVGAAFEFLARLIGFPSIPEQERDIGRFLKARIAPFRAADHEGL
jgi:hypothetical protein